jgi:hypothetical protein
MGHPIVHAESSVRKWGGTVEDYLPIHDLLDSSKAVFSDNRHRALTHNSWFIFVVEKVFGHEITVQVTCPRCRGTKWIDSTPCRQPCWKCAVPKAPYYDEEVSTGLVKQQVKVRYICEQHILEDFGGKFIPTASDYLENLEFKDWMNNGVSGSPSSHKKLDKQPQHTKRMGFSLD